MTDADERQPKSKNGLPCRACGSERNEVIKVRLRRSDDAIKRRHQCKDCGARFSSTQVIDPPDNGNSAFHKPRPNA